MIPKLRGTNIQVKTLVVAVKNWQLTPQQVADEYGISEEKVNNVMAFYEQHRQEIDTAHREADLFEIALYILQKSSDNGGGNSRSERSPAETT